MKTKHPNAYVINVVSRDHPGIVAAVAGAVEKLDGNVDSCSQTVLNGYFTLIMIASFADQVAEDKLTCEICDPSAKKQQMAVIVRKYSTAAGQQEQSNDRFVATLIGPDRHGIVLKFSQYMAGKDINITDLFGQEENGEFVLIAQVQIPASLDIRMLQADLAEMGAESGLAIRLQHENIFLATNQLRMIRPQPMAQK